MTQTYQEIDTEKDKQEESQREIAEEGRQNCEMGEGLEDGNPSIKIENPPHRQRKPGFTILDEWIGDFDGGT